jgi:energy-coupling factor transport system permease protein
MEARGFGSETKPSHFRPSVWHTRDTMIVVVGAVIAAVSVGAAILAGEFNAIIG